MTGTQRFRTESQQILMQPNTRVKGWWWPPDIDLEIWLSQQVYITFWITETGLYVLTQLNHQANILRQAEYKTIFFTPYKKLEIISSWSAHLWNAYEIGLNSGMFNKNISKFSDEYGDCFLIVLLIDEKFWTIFSNFNTAHKLQRFSMKNAKLARLTFPGFNSTKSISICNGIYGRLSTSTSTLIKSTYSRNNLSISLTFN